MRLFEYQTKLRFAQFGIPISDGKVATTPEQAFQITQELNAVVVLKSQLREPVHLDADLIKAAQTPLEAKQFATEVLGLERNGTRIDRVLVEALNTIKLEFYVAVSADYRLGKPVLLASVIGSTYPDLTEHNGIAWEPINPLLGIRSYQIVSVASEINVPREHWRAFEEVVQSLYRCYVESDAILAEINPLILTGENVLLASGGSMVIDEQAFFRQPGFHTLSDSDNEPVCFAGSMQGHIGCITNGTGLLKAVIDLVHLYGSNNVLPGRCASIPNGASVEVLTRALESIAQDSEVRVLIANLFELSTPCDVIAGRLLLALQVIGNALPVFVRLQGEKSVQGTEILMAEASSRIYTADTLTDLVQHAVRFVNLEIE